MPEASPSRNYRVLMLGLFILSGALTDFLFVGILKIIWIWIYGAAYLALAMTLESKLRSRELWKNHTRWPVTAFLLGCLISHLFFVNHTREEVFPMQVESREPLVLKTGEFPELLYVTSQKLQKNLTESPNKKETMMVAESVNDYYCMKSFSIKSIEGVEIKNDKSSTWTLRFNKVGIFTNKILPSMDDSSWPWCKISFYKSN